MFIVVLVFLQNWRATIIPMVAVPVSLIGTFAVMAMLGFSLNNLSLFGLVLAIGIVVDDAIVVVENVERWLAEGLSPRDATRKAMDEVTGPVIAIALVLCAVFVPTAFMAGISGQFFRQFALTIAASTIISAFNSLTLSPALCALLLKPHEHGEHGHVQQEALPRWASPSSAACWPMCSCSRRSAALVGIEVGGHGHGAARPRPTRVRPRFGLEGRRLRRRRDRRLVCRRAWSTGCSAHSSTASTGSSTSRSTATAGSSAGLLRLSVIVLLVYGGLMGLTYLGFKTVPIGFIPEQDKGYLVVNAQLPDGASLERTDDVVREAERDCPRRPRASRTRSTCRATRPS